MIEWILAAALALSIAGNAILGGAVHFLVRSNESMMRVISADYRASASEDGSRWARAWRMYKRGAEDNNKQEDKS